MWMASVTTNELVKLLKDADIQLEAMDPDTEYDNPLGMGSGAGVIFGASGGVMEAALRTAAEKMTGTALESIDFTEVRGMHGVKDATVKIWRKRSRKHVAVVSGLANANMLLNRIKSEEADYQFVEVMACPGGCVNGGGQPHQDGFDSMQCKMFRHERVRAGII
ncbi:MAG: [Fe-Fe] hydrogenase large subunit C-terminal domain-containing protein [Eubacterium sp.]